MTRSGLFLLLFCALVFTACDDGGAREAPPNLVVILADDLGYGDPGAYNPASKIPTPHLDRLADEGMRFTDAHSPSAVCTPTRYGLLTGRYAWRTPLKRSVLFGYDPLLIDTTRLTLPALLRREGYATAAVGKWHLGLGSTKPVDYAQPLRPGPTSVGFDTFFGIPASLDMDPYVYVEDTRVVEAPTDSAQDSQMRRDGGEGFWRAGPRAPSFYHADVLPTLEARAADVLEDLATHSPEQPFFLYVALTAPHTPWMPDTAFSGTSGAGPYGDFAAQVDATVGRLLGVLDETGAAEGTIVVFASDNGAHWLPSDIDAYGHRANADWRGQKADIWEGGHRVPFIVRWPGQVPAGTVSGETVSLVDLMATAADVVSTPLPRDAGEDSHSLLPVLRGETLGAPLREATVHHSGNGLFAIRQGPWKLIEGLGSGGFTPPAHAEPAPGEPAGQLYHLSDDPGETRNLYAEQPEVVARLQALLDRYRTQGYSRPMPADHAASP